MSLYSPLPQHQLLVLAALGGLLLAVAIGIAYGSFRLGLSRREPGAGEAPPVGFPDGLAEGREAVPLLVILIIAGVLIGGTAYGVLRFLGSSPGAWPDCGTAFFGSGARGNEPSVRPYEQPAGWPAPGAVAVDQVFGVASREDPDAAGDAVSPLAGNRGAEEAGKVAYRRYCWACHGPRLDGLSTVGPSFPRGRMDLTASDVTRQGDGVLFWKIWNGTGNMPSLGSTLTATEAWQVIAYLRGYSR